MKPGKIGWMLVVASVLMAGCRASEIDEDTCTQNTDCATGQQCNKATGQCVAVSPQDRNPLCTTSEDCLPSELCHPTAKVCVQTCRASADCPDTAKVCDVVSATDSTKVCHCATDTLCNQGRQKADLVCSNLDRVCTPRCVSNADCGTGRTCDTASGQCAQAQVEPRNLRCQQDTDCLTLELCHPTAKVCVQTCESSIDCPDAAKRCDLLSATDTRRVCKCSTTELCNIDRDTPDLLCSSEYSVCMPKCTADTDCPTGQRCDATTRQCKPEASNDTGKPCTGEGQSTCAYGTHFCSSAQCTPLPAPTCENYEKFTGKGGLGTTGRILYNARVVSAATDTAACGSTTFKRVKIALSAYSNVSFPSTKEELSGLFLVKVDGTVWNGSMQVLSSSDYVVSGTSRERAEITVSLCTNPSSTTLSTGFYFTNGNFLCFQANY
ncbi:hypothetical protein [Archangium violaceum]|uniref:hypothetical protein n=1 Tax=Archangium violaceum TaxID=83451 RepID=UPI0037C06797